MATKKYNILVPLAGKGQRMIDGGYLCPKPMIMVGDRHIIDYSMGSIDTSECNIIMVIRRDHICNHAIDKSLRAKYGEDIRLVVAEEDTAGAVSSCLLAKNEINNDLPLIVFAPDIYFEPKFVPNDDMFRNDGYILTFKANSTNYSYVQHDASGNVTRTAEKVVISSDASVGVYCFKDGRTFVSLAEEAVTRGLKSRNEFYICPLYNQLIARGGVVKSSPVEIMYIMGTPEEMKFFKDTIFPYFLPRSFILCADHSGFAAKETARRTLGLLKDNIPNLIDCGCYSADDCDYSDYISQAVEARKFFPGAMIMGFCRTGQGVNMYANKLHGVRAALVHDRHTASLAIRHNAANFFSVPGLDATDQSISEIIGAIMNEKFEGGRHQNRIQKDCKA